jgi:uncharacterized membrane protein YkvA (DUF1232 family)
MPFLAECLNHLWEGGLESYLESGSRALTAEDSEVLLAYLPHIRSKADSLLDQHPRLRGQLLLIADLFETEYPRLPETVRKEAAFTLLYAATETDLLPDHLSDVGHLDDAAIAEILLSRHAEYFEHLCIREGLDWSHFEPHFKN